MLIETAMQTTRVFTNGNSQAVRLPKEFRFTSSEVFIRKDAATGDVVLSVNAPSGSWADFFALRAKTRVPEDFLTDRPLNESKPARDPFAGAVKRPRRK
jgi:antitoxin VapB